MSTSNTHYHDCLTSPHLHAAFGLRDPSGAEYAQYANGSQPVGQITYDATQDAAKITLTNGGASLHIQDYLRLSFPELRKGVDQEVSFQWEARWSQGFLDIRDNGVHTHKAFRLDHQANRPVEAGRRFELQTRYGSGPDGTIALPTIRSYHNGPHGGDGEANPLSSHGRDDYQPGGQSDGFVIAPDTWVRFTLSVTWHDGEQRIRLWMADEHTDPVLVIADPDDPSQGFLADMSPGTPVGLDQFVVLFDTSQEARGEDELNVWVRNIVVFKDATVPLGGRPGAEISEPEPVPEPVPVPIPTPEPEPLTLDAMVRSIVRDEIRRVLEGA